MFLKNINYIITPLILVPIVPYLGQYGLYNLVSLSLLVFILFLNILISMNNTKIENFYSLLIFIILINIILMIFSSLNSILINQAYLVLGDLSELFRPLLLASIILLVSRVRLTKNELEVNIIFTISVLTILNFLISLFGFIGSDFAKPIIDAYGEAAVYHNGYAKFRAFGIIGQPGKQAYFSSLMILIVLITKKMYSRTSILLLLSLNFTSLLLTFSRTSLIILMLFLLIYLIFTKTKIFFLLSILIYGAFYFSNFNFESIEFLNVLSRGLDFSSGKLSTLSHRMVLKQWALDFNSSNLSTILFGAGFLKDYIGQFTHPFAFDLTLRHPDSSFTLWYLRYGVIGFILQYLIYLLLIFKSLKISSNVSYLIFYSLIISFFDPSFHDPKIVIFQTTIFILLINYDKKKSSCFIATN